MLILTLKRDPEWIDTVAGVRLLCRPLSSAMMLAIRSDLAGSDVASDDVEGMQAAFTIAVAKRSIIDWDGVGDGDGNPIEVTPEGIAALMDLHKIFEAFTEKVVNPYLLVQSEKNASAPSPNGTSAAAGNIATPATASATSAQDN